MQAVRSRSFAGVLPTFAREILPTASFRMTSVRALDSVTTPLLLAWRPRTLEVRAQARALRDALGQVIRAALKKST